MVHYLGTANVAEEIAKKLGEDSEMLWHAGLYHDIGRCLTKDKDNHTYHEIIGARFIEGEGLNLGLASNQEECNELARLIRPHFLVYEQFTMDIPEFSRWKPGLSDTNPELLLPETIGQKIIVYADLTNLNGQIVDFDQRMSDIKDRDRQVDNPRLKAIEAGEQRLYTIKEHIESLIP